MALTEEQRLEITVLGRQAVADLTGEIQKEEMAVLNAKRALDQNQISQAAYDAQLRQSTAAIAAHRQQFAGWQTQMQQAAASGGAFGALGAGLSGYRQNLIGLSYALNDFASNNGDVFAKLNGVANNLPMLFAGKLHPIGLALSALIPVINLVVQNWDSLTDLFVTKNPMPETAETAETLAESLKAASKEFEGLKSKTALSNEELERFKILEKEIAEQRDRLAASRRRESVEDTTSEASKARADEFGKAVDKLGGSKVVEDLKTIIAEANTIKGQLAITPQALEHAVTNAVAALNRGDRQVLQNVKDMVQAGFGRTTELAQGIVDGFKSKQEELVETLKEGQRIEEERKRAEAEAKKKADDNAKLVEELNRKGQDGQEAFFGERDANKKKAEADQEKDSEAHRKAFHGKTNEAIDDLGKNSTIGADMRSALEQLRKEGGYQDKFGRDVNVDPNDWDKLSQIQAEDADERLKRERPDLSQNVRRAVAAKMANQAMAEAQAAQRRSDFENGVEPHSDQDEGHPDLDRNEKRMIRRVGDDFIDRAQRHRAEIEQMPERTRAEREAKDRARSDAREANREGAFNQLRHQGVSEQGSAQAANNFQRYLDGQKPADPSSQQGHGFCSVGISGPPSSQQGQGHQGQGQQGPTLQQLIQAINMKDQALSQAMAAQAQAYGALAANQAKLEGNFNKLANFYVKDVQRAPHGRSIGR